jgi:hypothetical protein
VKRYGDAWGCCANTYKRRGLLVGLQEAAAEACRLADPWGSASLHVVDNVKCLDGRLNCTWTWDMCTPAANRKDLGAYLAQQVVLSSQCTSAATKQRIMHSVVRSLIEDVSDVCGLLAHLIAELLQQGCSHHSPPLLFPSLFPCMDRFCGGTVRSPSACPCLASLG